MPVLNAEIAEKFEEIADLLEIEAASPFRVRAYRNAARVISGWPKNLADLAMDGGLPKLPGIGADLSEKIEEIVRTRKLGLLDDLRKKTPPGLVELLKIPGLGPKRVAVLSKKLGIRSIADLKRAVREGKVAKLRGFGPKTEERIAERVAVFREKQKLGSPNRRISLFVAEQTARPLLEYMKEFPGIEAVIAGSYRRRCETVGDLDVLVTVKKRGAARSKEVREHFLAYEDRARTLASGETKSTIVLRSGLQVDLRVVPMESFGAALHYFTGSKAHNIAIRAMGVKRGLKINEYGVFRGARRIAGKSELEVYRSVGLPYIEPELRENRGEIEAAREGRLPKLVTLHQIRGDLHAHSKATDGRQSIEEMAEAARARGYEYLAITDHSKHLSVTRGLSSAQLKRQIREIDRINEKFGGKWGNFRLLKGIEVDILESGELDLPEEVLSQLDLTVCSIHYKFDLPRKKQTERILRAMDQRSFKILGHPTARILGERPGIDVDLEKVIQAAKDRGCFLEVNAQPERSDLSDVYCRLAREIGVKLAISTDAHSENDLAFMRAGVEQARRGWLEATDVINTRPWAELEKLLRR